MRPMPAPLGLYIHIPFCKSKCAYCDFYSLPRSESRMDDYTDALCAHLAETAPFAAGHLVDTVYFGGGTPSYLGTKRLVKILKTILKKYKVDKQAEITLEANPDSAGDWKELRTLRRCGFNRLSLGMQSADDEELSEIGRVHTMAQTEAAVEAARKAKFQNLSLDLIYGLPHQTLEGWQKNLSAALDLTPEHLSCYGLKVEEGTPLFARRGTAGLPGDDAQADMYLYTVEFLKAQGYEQYEISNFAKPGCASRHNLKYWTLGEYAGFGPGAHSDFGGVRYAYTKDLEGYIRGVRDHAPMLSESDRIPPLDLKHGRHRRRAHPAADTPGGVHIDCHALPPFPRAAPAVPFYCNTPRRFLQVFSAAGGTFFPQTPSCIWETLCNLVDFVAPFPFTFPPVYAILKRIM